MPMLEILISAIFIAELFGDVVLLVNILQSPAFQYQLWIWHGPWVSSERLLEFGVGSHIWGVIAYCLAFVPLMWLQGYVNGNFN